MILQNSNICFLYLSNRKPFRLLPPVTFHHSTCSTIHTSSIHTGKANVILCWIFHISFFIIIHSLHLKTFLSTSCSYLGNGLYAARLATLGALGADGRVSETFCHLSGTMCCVLWSWHRSCPGRSQQSVSCLYFGQVWIGKSSLVPAFLKSSEKMWHLVEPPTKLAGFQMVR